ncbi:MAG TPA: RNA methyltransferase [Caldilineae bacterium]|nr:RNA methyltransferase [Caldilineae bacterium]
MDKEALFAQLLADGLVDEADRVFWDLLTPQRIQRMLEVLSQRTSHITVVLEAVDDGHNQAAVLRSAEAFGVQEIGIIVGRAPFAPSEGVTQGAHKWLTLRRYPDIRAAVSALRERGYRIWASRLDEQAVPVDRIDLSQPAAFLFGNEHEGLSEDALALADSTFIVPMVGFVESLNISVAAAITLFHTTRRARAELGERYFLTQAERRQILRRWLRTATPSVRRLHQILQREGSN